MTSTLLSEASPPLTHPVSLTLVENYFYVTEYPAQRLANLGSYLGSMAAGLWAC